MTTTTEQESRQIAEQARETEWEGRTFLRELFLGNLLLPLIHPFPLDAEERPEFTAFYQKMERFLRDEVDSAAIDHQLMPWLPVCEATMTGSVLACVEVSSSWSARTWRPL